MLKEHTTYEAGVLLGLHMLRLENGVGSVRLALDNQAVIVSLDVPKSGPAQYLTGEILRQARRIWKQASNEEYKLE